MVYSALPDNNSTKNFNYINHQFLKENLIEKREYQVNIAKTAFEQNTLVVLPTALGKTIIALLTLIKILEKAPQSKIFILAPTRPLVVQHFTSFQNFLKPKIKCCLFSSNLTPVKRTYALNENQIFFSTPQIIQNDVRAGLYSLKGVGQIIFDETHKARKKYAYTFVAAKYIEQCSHPLILGITASPGKDLFRINELCQVLQIEQIIFRDEDSPDVKDYTYGINTIINKIEMPDEITKSKIILDTAIRKIRDYLLKKNVIPKRNYVSKFQFIQLIQDLKQLEIILDPYLTEEEKLKYLGDGNPLNYPHLAELFDPNQNDEIPNKPAIFSKAIDGIYLTHLKEILTTQDVRMFRKYLLKLENRAKNGKKRLWKFLNSKYIKGILKILEPIHKSPKILEILNILEDELEFNPQTKIIIFTQYREMGQYLVDELNTTAHMPNFNRLIKAKRFVGQASRENDKGLKQKEQSKMIKDFSSGIFNILVATSVAEEGLDIPNVDAVIFYDSVPSEIRLIQRRGRTGRHKIGRCYCLVTSNTLDEIYYHVSHRREQKMNTLLKTPGIVKTVPSLERSKSLPVHKKRSLEDIKSKFKKIKEEKEKLSLEKIEDILANRKKHTVFDNKHGLVKDYTKILTETSKKRIERIDKYKSQKIDPLKFLTKKIYRWIVSTMECIGSQTKNHIYCELDDLYSSAQEEGMDLRRIEIEIDKAIQANIFKTNNSLLILKI